MIQRIEPWSRLLILCIFGGWWVILDVAPSAASQPAEGALIERPSYGAISLNAPQATQRTDVDSERPADTTPPRSGTGLPLTPYTSGDHSSHRLSKTTLPIVTISSSLAVVLGLFAAFVWIAKKANRSTPGNHSLSDEAVCVLGQKSLGNGGSISLIRCGSRVLVCGITATGMHPLASIEDEAEVRQLEALCAGTPSVHEPPRSFRETLEQVRREPAGRGFDDDATAARKRLFAEV